MIVCIYLSCVVWPVSVVMILYKDMLTGLFSAGSEITVQTTGQARLGVTKLRQDKSGLTTITDKDSVGLDRFRSIPRH